MASTTDGGRPFREIADFIALLKDSPHWTEVELIEVQSRVVRGLLERQGVSEAG